MLTHSTHSITAVTWKGTSCSFSVRCLFTAEGKL